MLTCGWIQYSLLKSIAYPYCYPLKKPLHIELYNEQWFGRSPSTFFPPFKHDHVTLSFPPAITTPFPRLFTLYHETNTSPPISLLENVGDDDRSPPIPAALHKSLLYSNGIFLSSILQRIHLNRFGVWYKLTWTRAAN